MKTCEMKCKTCGGMETIEMADDDTAPLPHWVCQKCLLRKRLTREQADKLHAAKVWEGWTPREIAERQLSQPDCIFMPPQLFFNAMKQVLERSILTHEYSSSGIEKLRKDLFQGREEPTVEEILSYLKED